MSNKTIKVETTFLYNNKIQRSSETIKLNNELYLSCYLFDIKDDDFIGITNVSGFNKSHKFISVSELKEHGIHLEFDISPVVVEIYERMLSILSAYNSDFDSVPVKLIIDKLRPKIEQYWHTLTKHEKQQLMLTSGWSYILYYITNDQSILKLMVQLIKDETTSYRDPYCFKCTNDIDIEDLLFTPYSYELHKDENCWNISCNYSDCGCFNECTCDVADMTDFD